MAPIGPVSSGQSGGWKQYKSPPHLTQSPSPHLRRRGKQRPGGSPLSGKFESSLSTRQVEKNGDSSSSTTPPLDGPSLSKVKKPFAPPFGREENHAVDGLQSSGDDLQSSPGCESPAVPGTCVSVSCSRRNSTFSRKGSVREVSATAFLSSIALVSPTSESPPVKFAAGKFKSKEPDNDSTEKTAVSGDAAVAELNKSGQKPSQDRMLSMDTVVSEEPSGAKTVAQVLLPRKVVPRKTISEQTSKGPPDTGGRADVAHPIDSKICPPAEPHQNASFGSCQRRATICGPPPHGNTAIAALDAADQLSHRLQPPPSAFGIVGYRRLSKGCLADAVSDHRVYFATPSGFPFAVYCLIRHNDKKVTERRTKRNYLSNQYIEKIAITGMDALKKKKAESYAHFLTQANCLGAEQPEAGAYNPYYLDDPELRTGKHRTVISLPCFMGSIIQYTRPADLKKELNEHFRATHPNVDPSLTLSQIRKIKSQLISIGQELDLEISSVAKSFAYFEKLVIKNLVTKANRKLIAGVCLLLATKVNERKGINFSVIVDSIAKHLEVTSKDIRNHEFSVFVALEFTLYIQRHEFMPHFERVFSTMDYNNVSEYLGDNQFYLGSN